MRNLISAVLPLTHSGLLSGDMRTLIYPYIQDGTDIEFTGIFAIDHELGSDQACLDAFLKAIKDWLHNTDEGRRAWENSAHDFNFGDLALHEDIPMPKEIKVYGYTQYPKGIHVNHDHILY